MQVSEMNFGAWLKQQRLQKGLSQKKVSELSGGKIKPSTLSSYESNNVQDLSTRKIFQICNVLGIQRREIPWHLLFDDNSEQLYRVGIRDLSEKANMIKLFNGHCYEVRGELVKSLESGEIKPVAQIYYQVRSAMMDGVQIAKRKNVNDELCSTTS